MNKNKDEWKFTSFLKWIFIHPMVLVLFILWWYIIVIKNNITQHSFGCAGSTKVALTKLFRNFFEKWPEQWHLCIPFSRRYFKRNMIILIYLYIFYFMWYYSEFHSFLPRYHPKIWRTTILDAMRYWNMTPKFPY